MSDDESNRHSQAGLPAPAPAFTGLVELRGASLRDAVTQAITAFSRKHTASVHDSFAEIRRIIEALVQKRDERRDGFVKAISKAMHTTLGDNADEVLEAVAKLGVSRAAIKEALEIAKLQGRFTIFALVDALTRISAKTDFAGDRADADERAAKLLNLVEV